VTVCSRAVNGALNTSTSDLNEALVRRTLSRVADPAFEAAGIVWFAEKEDLCDPTTSTHAGGVAASQLRRYNHPLVSSRCGALQPVLPPSADQLGPEEIRKYQAMLFTKLKYSPNTVILRLAALRFFYIHVLKRGWSIARRLSKKVRHLQGTRQEEVARLIEAADTTFHRILLMTMYATGARRAEAAT